MLFMVDSCMGDKRNTQDIIYSWLTVVCGDKREKDINCGGEKDTTCYSWLTVVWETKEIHKI